MIRKNASKVLITSLIATTLAFPGVTAGAFANGQDETLADQGSGQVLEQVLVNNTNEEVTTAEDGTENVDTGETVTVEDEETQVALLKPGSFFYFFKTVTERIRLALTFDDIEKAKLMVVFAGDRIEEAEALLNEGKEELASETLLKALDQQEMAIDYSENEKEVVVENDDSEETTEEETDQEVIVDESVEDELEAKFANNIAALTAAMDKVQNPKAKEVLARNIEKAMEKLQKRIEKYGEFEEAMVDKTVEIEGKLAAGEITQEEAEKKLDEVEKTFIEKQKKMVRKVDKDIFKLDKEQRKIYEESMEEENDDEDDEDDEEIISSDEGMKEKSKKQKKVVTQREKDKEKKEKDHKKNKEKEDKDRD